jgi:RNA polymerase sigma-70 factor (ECF subfamily)
MGHRMGRDLATLDDLLIHAEWMQGLARRLLRNPDDADDVVQDAWLSALRGPPQRGRTLRPWIATVVLNLVRSRARSRVRTRAREALIAAPEPTPGADEQLVQHQLERQLAQLVLDLDEPYRRTILQRFHDGQSSADIARAEGIPEGTVRWRLKQGLDQLRGRFAEAEARGEAGSDAGGTTAFGALVLIARPSPSTAATSAAAAPAALAPTAVAPAAAATSTWLAPVVALVKGKLVLTAAGTVAALVGVTAGVRHLPARLHPVAPTAAVAVAARPISGAAAPGPWTDPTSVPTAPDDQAIETASAPDEAPPPATTPATATALASAAVPAAKPLVAITGVVRDSRGDLAARVPVTLRTLSGSGTADRTTTTDDAGRFAYRLQPRSKVLLTAELRGEPAARLEVEVPTRSAISHDARPSLTSTVASFATIDVALGSHPRASAPPRFARARAAENAPLSRWCCHEAFIEGDMVYGRSCLKFDDTRDAQQSGCDLYGLKAQVSCHRYTEGGLSTGDLSRTERLGCDGRLL